MIKPLLKRNAHIGIVAPSKARTKEQLNQGLKTLTDMGFTYTLGESCTSKSFLNLSGSDEVRANDINKMFSDPLVDGIICLGGGYGTPRIVDLLDYEMIQKNPKPFVGYSDITLLLNAITEKCGFITYHGPMVSGDFSYAYNDVSMKSFFDTVFDDKHVVINSLNEYDVDVINEGISEGMLVGGNLSLLNVLAQSEYCFDPVEKVLLIEEVHEENYRIDRMMQGLRLKGLFEGLNGVIIGGMTNEKTPQDGIKEVLIDFFQDKDYPVIFNLPIGHVNPRFTVPIGGKVKIDTIRKTIEF